MNLDAFGKFMRRGEPQVAWESVRMIQVPTGQRFERRADERVVSVMPGWNGMLMVGIVCDRDAPEEAAETDEAKVTGES